MNINFLFPKKLEDGPMRYFPAVVIVVCIVGFAGTYFYESYWRNRLAENGVITRCTVYKFTEAKAKSRSQAHYTIRIKGREIFFDGDLIDKLDRKLLYVSLPIIYDSTNVYNHRLLLSRKDFSELEIHFPDSLKWLDALGVK